MTMMSTASVPATRRGYLAVDLGASSGRVMLGVLEDGALELHEVHRFANTFAEVDGRLVWDFTALYDASLQGLRRGVELCRGLGAEPRGIGIDSWGVDYALLTAGGTVELPAEHYRGAAEPAPVIARRSLSEDEVFRISGIADQAINSALRLGARARTERLDGAQPLFTPDLWVYWLTGQAGAEQTIASTSQLLDVHTGQFSPALLEAVGLEGLALPEVHPPGTRAGVTTAEVTAAIGARVPVAVYRVASHDTASAFAFATPGDGGTEGLISSGTWSLVGIAAAEPVTTEVARQARFTNERGVDGCLFIRNLSGMWILQECLAEWGEADGEPVDIGALIAEAGRLPHDGRVFDAGDDRLLVPGGMVQRVRQLSAEALRPVADSRAAITRAVVDGLAVAYRTTIDQAARLTGTEVHRIRIVGGGSRNELLCQLTADLTGLPVLAGPVEASAVGNIAVQAHGDGTVASVRDLYQQMNGEGTAHARYEPIPFDEPNRVTA